MKTILKFFYLAFAVVLGVVIYLNAYNTAGFNYINNLTKTAIESKEYYKVGMIHGGCFDTKNISTTSSDKLDLVIFPSVTLESFNYYDAETVGSKDEKTITYNEFCNSYYIYIFNSNISDINSTTNGVATNMAGLRFKSNTSSYDYLFKITSDVNSSSYVEKPTTVDDYLLKGERNLFNYKLNYDFFNITLTSLDIKAMQNAGLEGAITGFDILDQTGNVIATSDVNLDFSQKFFHDASELVSHYNTYIKEYSASESKEDKKAAEDKFNAFYDGEDGFEKKFTTNTDYTFRYSDSYLRPGKLIWNGVGILAVFALCVVLIYILLFHFAFIKGLITGSGKGRVNYGAPRKTDSIKANVKPLPGKAYSDSKAKNVKTSQENKTKIDEKINEVNNDKPQTESVNNDEKNQNDNLPVNTKSEEVKKDLADDSKSDINQSEENN